LPPPLSPLAQFPYPILNKLPFPLGYAGFVALGFAVVLTTFQLGKGVKRALSLLGGGSSGSAGSAATQPIAKGSSGGGSGGKKEQ
jgi:hypothetical protein